MGGSGHLKRGGGGVTPPPAVALIIAANGDHRESSWPFPDEQVTSGVSLINGRRFTPSHKTPQSRRQSFVT